MLIEKKSQFSKQIVQHGYKNVHVHECGVHSKYFAIGISARSGDVIQRVIEI